MKEDSDEAKTESIITRSELFFFFFSLFLWNGAYINMLRYRNIFRNIFFFLSETTSIFVLGWKESSHGLSRC